MEKAPDNELTLSIKQKVKELSDLLIDANKQGFEVQVYVPKSKNETLKASMEGIACFITKEFNY